MELSERIKAVVEYSGLSIPKYSQAVGAQTPQAIRDLISGKTKSLSADMQNKILSYSSGVNPYWLLTGEGEMLSTENVIPVKTDLNSPLVDACVIPLLPTSAQAGSLNEFVTSLKLHDCEMIVSPVKGADFALPVNGDSMAPEYPNGSQIHVKRINENAFIEWGKVYVLDTCNGTVIKRIVPSEREGYVKCVSINPDPIYAPFEVAFGDIYGMYRVLLCLSIK